jgi:hypothetical protein
MLRNDFARMKKAYQGVKKGNVRLTQSDLVLIRAIDPTTTNYRFPVLENEAAIVYPDEVRLNINDEFSITHLGIYFGVAITEEEKPGDVPVQYQTHVPVNLESKGKILKGLFNGYLKVDVNNVNYVDKWNIKKHEMITETQFCDETPGVYPATQPNNDLKADGIFPVTPNIVLSGAKKNDVQIFLPRSISPFTFTWQTKTNGVKLNFNYIVVHLRGFLAQNAAKFQG